jgi:hypothetical protein
MGLRPLRRGSGGQLVRRSCSLAPSRTGHNRNRTVLMTFRSTVDRLLKETGHDDDPN